MSQERVLDLTSRRLDRAAAATQTGILVNAALAIVKFLAGILGHSYALVADGIESSSDIFSSAIVWSGLRVSAREADEHFPYGYGKAEPLAAAIVGLMLVGAAVGIAIQAVREILTPHHAPAAFTLVVLFATIAVKHWLARRTKRIAREVGSLAVEADSAHHLSDAITSGAAAIGIGAALIGGPGWEPADDWAALVASAVICWTGLSNLKGATEDLLDRAPQAEVVAAIQQAASQVPGVREIEKLRVRKAGMNYWVDIHVQTDGNTPLAVAHGLGGRVKSEIRNTEPRVAGVTVHMEPWSGRG
jgi:cation diffusion facilitator family transporter